MRHHTIHCLCKKCLNDITDEVLGPKSMEESIVPGFIEWADFKRGR